MTRQRVLISCRQLQETIDHYRPWFDQRHIDIDLPEFEQQLSENELMEMVDRYDGVIAGDDEFTADVLRRGDRLKVISKWGVGIDAIDTQTAKKLGIQVYNTPNVFADEVADVVTGYVIMLARWLHQLDSSVRHGEWRKIRGMSLQDKTLGVVGFGSIGQAVAHRGHAIGMRVLGYDVVRMDNSISNDFDVTMVALQELLTSSDFISLNCNLTDANRNMISRDELGMMNEGTYIINTARGALIDEAALVEALDSGRIAGAALDVFEQEPLPADSPLRRFDNCIFGTHNGSNTQEAVLRVNRLAIENLFRGLGGEA